MQPSEREGLGYYIQVYPYKVNPNYLTQAEAKLLRLLYRHFDERVAIGVKQRVADVLEVDDKAVDQFKINKFNALRAIAEKHVDFTLIDINRGIVICCIELDDFYHLRYENMQKDQFKDDIFKECGVPLFRIKTRIDKIDPKKDFRAIENEVYKHFAPKCPLCGREMLLREDRYGSRFYACFDNINCRKTISID